MCMYFAVECCEVNFLCKLFSSAGATTSTDTNGGERKYTLAGGPAHTVAPRCLRAAGAVPQFGVDLQAGVAMARIGTAGRLGTVGRASTEKAAGHAVTSTPARATTGARRLATIDGGSKATTDDTIGSAPHGTRSHVIVSICARSRGRPAGR